MEKPMRGTLIREEDKFFVEVEGRRDELMPMASAAEEKKLTELVGKEVEFFLSEPRRYVVGIRGPELRRVILCYVIPPWPPGPICYLPIDRLVLQGVEDQVRANLARRLLDQKVISQEVYDVLR